MTSPIRETKDVFVCLVNNRNLPQKKTKVRLTHPQKDEALKKLYGLMSDQYAGNQLTMATMYRMIDACNTICHKLFVDSNNHLWTLNYELIFAKNNGQFIGVKMQDEEHLRLLYLD